MPRRKTIERIEKVYQNKIKACRMRAMIDRQSDLAARTGISRSTINSLENNKLFLSSHYALAISEVLKCSLDDLYDRRHQVLENNL